MDTTLGERIRARRQRRGWKLKDLAEKTGLSVPYLSDLERQQGTNPTLETLQAVARALECEVSDLLGAAETTATDIPLSVSLQRFIDSNDFNRRLSRLAERMGRRGDDQLRSEVINFLATAPRRSRGELSKDDWSQLLDFYTVIAER